MPYRRSARTASSSPPPRSAPGFFCFALVYGPSRQARRYTTGILLELARAPQRAWIPAHAGGRQRTALFVTSAAVRCGHGSGLQRFFKEWAHKIGSWEGFSSHGVMIGYLEWLRRRVREHETQFHLEVLVALRKYPMPADCTLHVPSHVPLQPLVPSVVLSQDQSLVPSLVPSQPQVNPAACRPTLALASGRRAVPTYALAQRRGSCCCGVSAVGRRGAQALALALHPRLCSARLRLTLSHSVAARTAPLRRVGRRGAA